MKFKQKQATLGTLSLVLALPIAASLLRVHGVRAEMNGKENEGMPNVTITAPGSNSVSPWSSRVSYQVTVTYQGKSTQYEELPANQVLLKAAYVQDVPSVADAASRTPAGLLYILNSKCLGCHDFKAKAMGPSFAAIGQRYPESQAAMDLLSRKIRSGSTGLWGPNSMPPQPELTEAQLHAIVLWITSNAADPLVQYSVGTEGTFRMEAAGTPGPKSGMLLTASYTDLAPGADPEQAPHAETTVMVRGK